MMKGMHTLAPWNLRKGTLVILICGLALSTAGCRVEPAVPAAVKSNPEQQTTKPEEPRAETTQTKYQAPLTGLPLEQKNDIRPAMVVVNNAPQARPQSGLSQADILFEVLAEGEITRLIAFFQSSAFQEPIGPVRSIRPYFISLGKSYGAIQVHAGGSPDGYEMISREKIENMDEITNAGPYFWREPSRKAPHNLYTNLTKIREGAARKGFGGQGPAQPVYLFAKLEGTAVEVMGGGSKPASKVDVTFLLKSYQVSYTYDESVRLYKRAINGEPHVDLNNGEALSAANVVVLGAEHKVLDNEGRREVKLTGQGPAVLFQRGLAKPVEWKREQEDSPIRFIAQGHEVALVPGQTHILIVPVSPSFEERFSYHD